MPNQDGLVGKLAEQNGLDVSDGRLDVEQVLLGDATESRVVIQNGIVRHDERLVNRFAIRRNNGDSRELGPFRRVAHLAIQRVDAVVAVRRRRFGHRAHKSLQVDQTSGIAYVPFSHGTTVGIGLPFAAGITSLTTTGEGFAPMIGTGVVSKKIYIKNVTTTS